MNILELITSIEYKLRNNDSGEFLGYLAISSMRAYYIDSPKEDVIIFHRWMRLNNITTHFENSRVGFKIKKILLELRSV